jgi:glycine hydroxymethyltransferase
VSSFDALSALNLRGFAELRAQDAMLAGLLEQEHERQRGVLTLVAASSVASPSVLCCESTPIGNLTLEGYPGARFHGGATFADRIERLAIERATALFGARYANVQPHSGSSANLIVLFGILQPGDRILGLDIRCGGHLTHGSRASITGRYFESAGYGVGDNGLLDYDAIAAQAREFRPHLIVCGASAYPRSIDFARFRAIADEVGAYLLADISHIAGLVAAGLHQSPIDHAHFTTTSTYKQLYGPRGGLVLMGRDADRPGPGGKRSLAEMLQKATFPLLQGTPHLSTIAAKARAFALASTPQFRALAKRVVSCAKALAAALDSHGYQILTGGTDSHLLLVDLTATGLTGAAAEAALERCDIVVNRNILPNDRRPAAVASGLRLGTNTVALRGMGEPEMIRCVQLIDEVLRNLRAESATSSSADAALRTRVLRAVRALCKEFELPGYGGEHAAANGQESMGIFSEA